MVIKFCLTCTTFTFTISICPSLRSSAETSGRTYIFFSITRTIPTSWTLCLCCKRIRIGNSSISSIKSSTRSRSIRNLISSRTIKDSITTSSTIRWTSTWNGTSTCGACVSGCTSNALTWRWKTRWSCIKKKIKKNNNY